MEIKGIHVCMEVENFGEAMKFYGPLFAAGGFKKVWGDGKSYAGYGNGGYTLFIGATKPRRVTRRAPTGEELVVTDHVGFAVGQRRDVDAIDAAMRKAGFKPLFPAAELPEFGPGFYAVTYCDADNNVIEFSHR